METLIWLTEGSAAERVGITIPPDVSPSGKQSSEEALFGWIVSDFGLNDTIEAGLVKTPRIVARTNALPKAATYKDEIYHIYDHVRDDLDRKAQPTQGLPDFVTCCGQSDPNESPKSFLMGKFFATGRATRSSREKRSISAPGLP